MFKAVQIVENTSGSDSEIKNDYITLRTPSPCSRICGEHDK
jgi:hypothetical protein